LTAEQRKEIERACVEEFKSYFLTEVAIASELMKRCRTDAMNRAEIAQLRQSLFRESMEEIRRKVRLEKSLTRHEPPLPTTMRRGKEVRKSALSRKTSKHCTNSSFATALRDWWVSQTQFRLRLELAAVLKTDRKTVSNWFASKKFPRGRLCETLFEVSDLEGFSPVGRAAARCEHELNRRAKKTQR
jgi:hypothetical protein